jgi:hypothetical protein
MMLNSVKLYAVRTFIAAALVLTAMVSLVPAAMATSGPPNNVYTCQWINAHPQEAATASVSCGVPFPSSLIGPDSAGTSTSAGPLASGCQRVPAVGDVSPGVFAWTTVEYSNWWSFGPSVSQSYTWYVQKSSGVNYVSGSASAYAQVNVPPNDYRGGGQNNGTSVMHWSICYDVL